MAETKDDIVTRRATPDEISSYILPTWLSSYCLGMLGRLMRADSRHGTGREEYWKSQRGKIERILSTATVTVQVAVFDAEPVGWIVCDERRRKVHYVFVNRAFREQGVAKKLMPAWFSDSQGGPVFIGHLPPPWFTRKKNPDDKAPPWQMHQVIDLVSSE